MIRVVIYLLLTAIISWGAVWIANHPGVIVIEWSLIHSQPVEVPIGYVVVALVLFATIVITVFSIARGLIKFPDVLSLFLRRRRIARGYLAITRGLIAVGAGDPYAARRFAREASRIASDEPLALLLAAQSAQLAGNRAVAEETFRTMASREDTKLIGLHGLFVEAQRRDDAAAAQFYAEEAAKAAPSLSWAGQATLQYRCAGGDWVGAIEALDRNRKNDLVGRSAYRRQRAVLLTARALTLMETERDAATTMVLDAVKLAPGLIPAVGLAGRLLAEAGETRRAARLIERAWRANPHPDLAIVYAHLRPGDSARDRLARVQDLAQVTPGHIEGAFAIARTAVDAREFSVARASLAPFLSAPTQRLAMLMAEIEDLEHGDVGRAREWMRRALNAERDPAWTADGVVSEKWLPVSPVTGQLDAFEWRVPLAHLGTPGPVIEEDAAVKSVEPAATAEAERADAVMQEELAHEEDIKPRSIEPAAEKPDAAAAAAVITPPVLRPRVPEAVIPLIHVPDDPGPDAEDEDESAPEHQGEGWRRLRGLFW
jgi:HemY protein